MVLKVFQEAEACLYALQMLKSNFFVPSQSSSILQKMSSRMRLNIHKCNNYP